MPSYSLILSLPPTQPLNSTKAITHMRTHIFNHFLSSPALYKPYFTLLPFSTIYKQHTYSLRTVYNSVSSLNKNRTQQLHATSHRQRQGRACVLRTTYFCPLLIIFHLDLVGCCVSYSPAEWSSYLEKIPREKRILCYSLIHILYSFYCSAMTDFSSEIQITL